MSGLHSSCEDGELCVCSLGTPSPKSSQSSSVSSEKSATSPSISNKSDKLNHTGANFEKPESGRKSLRKRTIEQTLLSSQLQMKKQGRNKVRKTFAENRQTMSEGHITDKQPASHQETDSIASTQSLHTNDDVIAVSGSINPSQSSNEESSTPEEGSSYIDTSECDDSASSRVVISSDCDSSQSLSHRSSSTTVTSCSTSDYVPSPYKSTRYADIISETRLSAAIDNFNASTSEQITKLANAVASSDSDEISLIFTDSSCPCSDKIPVPSERSFSCASGSSDGTMYLGTGGHPGVAGEEDRGSSEASDSDIDEDFIFKLTPSKTPFNFKEGDIVWAKWKKFCYYPALIKKNYKKKKRMTLDMFYPEGSDLPDKIFSLSYRKDGSVVLFDGPKHDEILRQGYALKDQESRLFFSKCVDTAKKFILDQKLKKEYELDLEQDRKEQEEQAKISLTPPSATSSNTAVSAAKSPSNTDNSEQSFNGKSNKAKKTPRKTTTKKAKSPNLNNSKSSNDSASKTVGKRKSSMTGGKGNKKVNPESSESGKGLGATSVSRVMTTSSKKVKKSDSVICVGSESSSNSSPTKTKGTKKMPAKGKKLVKKSDSVISVGSESSFNSSPTKTKRKTPAKGKKLVQKSDSVIYMGDNSMPSRSVKSPAKSSTTKGKRRAKKGDPVVCDSGESVQSTPSNDSVSTATSPDESPTLKVEDEDLPLSKKGLLRLQKIKEKNEPLVQFLVSKKCKKHLRRILLRKVSSDLHQRYMTGSLGSRRNLQHQGFGPISDEDQIQYVVNEYAEFLKCFKLDFLKWFGYVLDVWVPEAVVYGLTILKKYPVKKAWEVFYKGVRSTKEEEQLFYEQVIQQKLKTDDNTAMTPD